MEPLDKKFRNKLKTTFQLEVPQVEDEVEQEGVSAFQKIKFILQRIMTMMKWRELISRLDIKNPTNTEQQHQNHQRAWQIVKILKINL